MYLLWCEGLEAAGRQDVTESKETEIGAQAVMVQHKELENIYFRPKITPTWKTILIRFREDHISVL